MQLIFVIYFEGYSLECPLCVLELCALVAFSIAIIALVVWLFASLANMSRLVVALATSSAFASASVLNYLRYSKSTMESFLNFAIFSAVVFGIYLVYAKYIAKKIDPSANALLILLCSLPLGVGMIFGGIVGFAAKKF